MLKGFLKGRPPSQWNGYSVDRDDWSLIIDNEFLQIKEENNKSKFLKLFEHISDMDILGIDKGEGFGIAKQNEPTEDKTVQLSGEDEKDISEYMTDMNMSAVASVSSEGKTSTLCTERNNGDSIFSIHSVGKIFTGMLPLLLVERGILREADLGGAGLLKMKKSPIEAAFEDLEKQLHGRDGVVLYDDKIYYIDLQQKKVDQVPITDNNRKAYEELRLKFTDSYNPGMDGESNLIKAITGKTVLGKPIQISESAKTKLPASVVEQLKNVTLHDVMVHKGGFGDFVGNYVKDIKSSLENKIELPKIKSLEDFLLYANAELSEPGKTRYSNLGSLLVGLAAEHAYTEYQKVHSELPQLNFNGMLQEFIQKPSGMTTLTDRAPKDAKVNTSTTIAEPTPEALYLVANPSGGYWTCINDLQKFGEWLYDKSQQANFSRLLSGYGQEFHLDDQTLGHKGENPSASAMLSVSLTNGRVIATLSNSSRTDAHDLEESIRENIFSKPVNNTNSMVKDNTTAQFRGTLVELRGFPSTVTDEKDNMNSNNPFKTTPKPPWEQ
ncbi:serine hydrolase [Legionella sainthelensi]|uniref:serine hydrolase n=1 Tax=Legionella sainthelensi TaxID=28087 RepID=UPI0013E40D4E|nr:serine hydrolase [Legionella sainthelensi]